MALAALALALLAFTGHAALTAHLLPCCNALVS